VKRIGLVLAALLIASWLFLGASCSGPEGRLPVSGRVVSKHDGMTVYEDRVPLQAGIVTCVTVKTKADVSVSCDWGD
jgi:hypothetical protein